MYGIVFWFVEAEFLGIGRRVSIREVFGEYIELLFVYRLVFRIGFLECGCWVL